jgi:hypothetical protein
MVRITKSIAKTRLPQALRKRDRGRRTDGRSAVIELLKEGPRRPENVQRAVVPGLYLG